MPARPRRSEELLAKVQDLVGERKDPTAIEVARTAADVHYGTEIGLAFISRGAGTVRGRQLLRDYDELSMWLNAKSR